MAFQLDLLKRIQRFLGVIIAEGTIIQCEYDYLAVSQSLKIVDQALNPLFYTHPVANGSEEERSDISLKCCDLEGRNEAASTSNSGPILSA